MQTRVTRDQQHFNKINDNIKNNKIKMNKIYKTVISSKGLIINVLILFLIGFLTRFFIFYLNNSNLFIELISFVLIGFNLFTDIFISYIFELFSGFKNIYMHNLNCEDIYKIKLNPYNTKSFIIKKNFFSNCSVTNKDHYGSYENFKPH